MSSGRNNPWRDLADTVAAQVNDALIQARHNKRGRSSGWGHDLHAQHPDPPDPRSPYLSWDDERAEYPDESRPKQPGGPRYVPTRITSSDLSNQLRGLLSETMGTATDSMRQRREDKQRLEPLRRARRRHARAKVAAGVFGVLTFGFAGGSVAASVYDTPAPAAAAGVLALGAGVTTVRTGLKARRYGQVVDAYETAQPGPTDITGAFGGLPVPPTIRELPPQSSAAYEPMRRLAAQEQVLTQMLPELLPVASDIDGIADESEKSLEQLAGRIVLLENAVAAASDDAEGDFDGLRTSLQRMVDRLSDGVHAHERLIANAASVLAELSGPTPGPTPVSGLLDAADGLQALATGMREVSRPTQHLSHETRRRPVPPPSSATDEVPDYGPTREAPDRTADRDRGH